MTSWRFTADLKDDVTAVYRIHVKVPGQEFFYVLKIDMNKFKSIWSLMLGILLLDVNRPGVAGLTPRRSEAHEDVRRVALYEGPRPKGELRLVDVNRLSHVTCIVR